MAAIDPSAAPQADESTTGPPRATLKLMRVAVDESDSEDDSDDSDYDPDDIDAIRARLAGVISDEESDESSSEEETNGGPSDPEKTKKAREQALLKKLLDSAEDEDMDDAEDLPNGVNGTKVDKGKGKEIVAFDEDDSSDSEDLGIEEFVLCTLDPNQVRLVLNLI